MIGWGVRRITIFQKAGRKYWSRKTLQTRKLQERKNKRNYLVTL